MKNKKFLIIVVVVILIVGIFILSKLTNLQKTEGITIVPTMNDKITADSSWCGTFQLIWNDMKKEIIYKDIVFNPQLDMVENLNKEDFNETMLSEDYYYKVWGLKTLSLKEQIEKEIKNKFNQKSDILDKLDWSNNSIILYAMLYRKFEYFQEFDKLDNGKFGDKYKDVEYFGIDKNTKNSVGDQIEVLYYNSKNDFAVIVNTKTDDEVIFCKGPKGKTFNEIYENMNKKTNKYNGSKSFENEDEFKAPVIEVDEIRQYNELENIDFQTANPKFQTARIESAIQSIKLSLDEKGGEIKSEAIMEISTDSEKYNKPRYFYLDNTFAIFLREKGKSKPYFASRIDDITKFQK